MPAQPDGESDYVSSPTLEQWTRGVVASLLEVPPDDVFHHEDGSFHLGRGNASIWVQPLANPSRLWSYSWMVTDVDPHPDLLAMINIHSAIGTVVNLDRAVRISHALLAERLDHYDVAQVIRIVADTAENCGHMIQEQFRGRLACYQSRGDEIDV